MVDLVGSLEGDVNFVVFLKEFCRKKSAPARSPFTLRLPSGECTRTAERRQCQQTDTDLTSRHCLGPRDCLLCFSSRAIYDSPVPVGEVKGWKKKHLTADDFLEFVLFTLA